MDAATAALIGAGIGVVGGGTFGFFTAWGVNRWQRSAAREARTEERRATAYFEVLVALYPILRAMWTEATSESSGQLPSDQSERATPARAFLAGFGSASVQASYGPVLHAVLAWDKQAHQNRAARRPNAELIAIAKTMETAVDELAKAMNAELHAKLKG